MLTQLRAEELEEIDLDLDLTVEATADIAVPAPVISPGIAVVAAVNTTGPLIEASVVGHEPNAGQRALHADFAVRNILHDAGSCYCPTIEH